MLIEAYFKNDYSYSVFAEGICSRPGIIVPLILDTGSPFTVISLETIYPNLSASQKDAVKQLFQTRNIQPIAPKSASGHSLICYPVTLSNVTLDNCTLREFPVYAVTNINRKLSLLGLDFLNCCKMTHQKDSDVFSLDLDSEKTYATFFYHRHKVNVQRTVSQHISISEITQQIAYR